MAPRSSGTPPPPNYPDCPNPRPPSKASKRYTQQPKYITWTSVKSPKVTAEAWRQRAAPSSAIWPGPARMHRFKAANRSGGRIVRRDGARTAEPTACSPAPPTGCRIPSLRNRVRYAGVVGEQGLADKPVDLGERAERVDGQCLVAHQQQAIGMAAIDRLAQRVHGKAEQAGAAAHALGARIDRAAGVELKIFDG